MNGQRPFEESHRCTACEGWGEIMNGWYWVVCYHCNGTGQRATQVERVLSGENQPPIYPEIIRYTQDAKPDHKYNDHLH